MRTFIGTVVLFVAITVTTFWLSRGVKKRG